MYDRGGGSNSSGGVGGGNNNNFERIDHDLMFDNLANFEYLLPSTGQNGETSNGIDIFDTPMQALHNNQYLGSSNHVSGSGSGSGIENHPHPHSHLQHQLPDNNAGIMNRPMGLVNMQNQYPMIHMGQLVNQISGSSGVSVMSAHRPQQQQQQQQQQLQGLPVLGQYSKSGTARLPDGTEEGDEKTAGGKVSKAQAVLAKEKRRERNKVLARKTRVKKKFELESLRDQAAKLHKENESLKMLVQTRLPPPVSASVLMQCDIQLPENVLALVNNMIARLECNQNLLMDKMHSFQRAFCISNACAADYPIVYASPGFVELTGYPLVEIIGRNCRFLQGPDTDKREARRLGAVMKDGKETNATLKNYRRDCSSFWNFIQIAPMKDTEGRITLMVGVQCDVTSPAAVTEAIASTPYASLTESTSLHSATQHQKQVKSFATSHSSAASSAGSAGHTSHDDRESREGSSNSGNENGGNEHNSPHSFERDSQCSGSRGESRSGSANGDSGEDLTE